MKKHSMGAGAQLKREALTKKNADLQTDTPISAQEEEEWEEEEERGKEGGGQTGRGAEMTCLAARRSSKERRQFASTNAAHVIRRASSRYSHTRTHIAV
jgi:hypothetical protein